MKKDAGRMGFSVSHGSETTACLERRAPTMRRERPSVLKGLQTRDQRNGQTEKLRLSDSMVEIEQASSNELGGESLSSDVFLRRN
ncbi:hypothetical protein TNCV_22471 [Trichonephila clavipes]|nr:hypothetical protein TNCV_22471 [Trichonephila clavipes]